MHNVYISCTIPYALHRYGYSHYLHEKIFAPNNVEWLWQDVICQYWGWAQGKHPLFPQSRAMDMKPALSVMHAKAHSWHCQVIFLKAYPNHKPHLNTAQLYATQI